MSTRTIKAGKAYVEIGIRNRIAKGAAGVQRDLKRMATKVTGLGKIVGGMGVALGTPFAVAASKMASFDDAMRQVGAISKASVKDLTMLTDTAKELGRTTSFTAVEVAGLMTELGRAGFDPGQINEMTGAVLNLSRATGTEASQSAGILAATIRQFGLEATDAARASDALTAAANGSFNTVEQLGDALSYAGPVAADLGMTMEETLAILGGLGNVGIQGSNAGTAIRRLGTLTAAESKKMERIFGVAFTDGNGNALPLVETLGAVAKATEDMGTAARASKFNEAFGLLGITAASSIGKAMGSIQDLQATIESSGGTAAETATKMDDGLGGSFRKILSAAEGVAIAVGESIEPALKSLVDMVTTGIGKFTAFIEANKGIVVAVAGVAAGLMAAGAALVTIGVSLAGASVVVGGLATAFGLLTTPIGLASVAVVGLGFAFAKYTKMGADSLQFFQDRFGPLVETVKGAIGAITSKITDGDLEGAWELAADTIELIWLDVTDGIRDTWSSAMAWFVDTGISMADAVAGVFEQLGDTIDGMISTYEGIYNFIADNTTKVTDSVIEGLTGVQTLGDFSGTNRFESQFGETGAGSGGIGDGFREFGQSMKDNNAAARQKNQDDLEASKAARRKRIDDLKAKVDTTTTKQQGSDMLGGAFDFGKKLFDNVAGAYSDYQSEEAEKEAKAKASAGGMVAVESEKAITKTAGSFSAVGAALGAMGGQNLDRERLRFLKQVAENTKKTAKAERRAKFES